MCGAISKQDYQRAHAFQMHLGCVLSSYFYKQVGKKCLLNPRRELPQHPKQLTIVREPNCTAVQRKKDYIYIILFK